MDQAQVQALVRHALTFLGGVLVTVGWADHETAMQITGALTALVSIAWSAIDKKKT